MRGTIVAFGIVLAGLVFCGVRITLAQSRNDKDLAFEVSSVKPTKPEDFSVPRAIGCHGVDASTESKSKMQVGLGRCHFERMHVYGLIAFAYGIDGSRPAEWGKHPSWLEDDWYEIDAIAPNPRTATYSQLRQMLQNLLSERFALKVHHEPKTVSGYAIAVSPGGSKLKRGTGPAPYTRAISGDIQFRGNLSTLTNMLTSMVQDRFVDHTGLSGEYDIVLKWGGQFKYFTRQGPSLPDALQQLGLKLQPEKIQVDVLVVDSIRR